MNFQDMTNADIQAAIDEAQERLKLLKRLKRVRDKVQTLEAELAPVQQVAVIEAEEVDPDTAQEAPMPTLYLVAGEPAEEKDDSTAPSPTAPSPAAPDYNSMGSRELRRLGVQAGIKNAGRMTKAELLSQLGQVAA